MVSRRLFPSEVNHANHKLQTDKHQGLFSVQRFKRRIPPTITFASTDIAMMGTYSYPDVTRIDNCQLTVEVEAGSPDVRQLFSAELQEWRVISLSSVLNVHTGLEEIVKYTYFAKGHLTEIPSVEISPGSEGKITLTLNCLFYKKIDGDGKVIDLIDRLARTVVIGGNDFSSKINLML